MLDVLAGYEVGDATWAPRPAEPYATAVRRDPGRLRVALTTSNALGVEPDAESLRGLQATGELLASLGHEVEETAPAMPDGGALELFRTVFGAAVSLQVTYGELLAGRPPEDDEIEPLSREIAEGAQRTSSVAYLAALAQLQALARGVIAFFAEYDLLLTPVPGRAPPGDRRAPRGGRRPVRGLPARRALRPLRAAVQRHGPAGDLDPGRVRRRRAADRRPARRQAARRGHAAAGRRAARGGPAVGRPAPLPGRRRGVLGSAPSPGARPAWPGA